MKTKTWHKPVIKNKFPVSQTLGGSVSGGSDQALKKKS